MVNFLAMYYNLVDFLYLPIFFAHETSIEDMLKIQKGPEPITGIFCKILPIGSAIRRQELKIKNGIITYFD